MTASQNDLAGGELFGFPHSYYTVIAKSYLRKQGYAFADISSRTPEFAENIVPKIGRAIIPVYRTRVGDLIQDSLDIIERSEISGPGLAFTPSGPKQKLISALLFQYGSQALLKPAMHYRWSYYDQQSAFLNYAFGLSEQSPQAGKVMDRMRSYLPVLGVTDDTIPAIETGYETLLSLLDAHFDQHPYLLGGRPSVGDCGMFGPLFAHLGRDPVPANIMKVQAPRVYRWTERMYATGQDAMEFDTPYDFVADDKIPDTLMKVIEFIGQEYGDEIEGRMDFIRHWLNENSPEDGQPVTDKPANRALGFTDLNYRGHKVTMSVQPYMLYCQRRIEAAFREMNAKDQEWTRDLFGRIGLSALINPELSMTVGRRNNIEVWEAI